MKPRGEPEARRFQLFAGHPVLDFVNTLDWRFRRSGPEELLNGYGDLLRFTRQSGLITVRDARWLQGRSGVARKAKVLSSAKELRETLAQILYAIADCQIPRREPLATFSAFVRSLREAQRLEWSNYRLVWKARPEENSLVEMPLQHLVSDAIELLSSDRLTNLGACSNRECRWLFLDNSKNKTRRWCNMELCGNRIKARRYRQKRHIA